MRVANRGIKTEKLAALRKVIVFLKNVLPQAIHGFLPTQLLVPASEYDTCTLADKLEAVYLLETKTIAIPPVEKEMIEYLAHKLEEKKYKEKILQLYKDHDFTWGVVPESMQIIAVLLDQREPVDWSLNKNTTQEVPISSFRFADKANPVLLKKYVEIAIRLASIAQEYETGRPFIEKGIQVFRNGEKVDGFNNNMLNCVTPVVISRAESFMVKKLSLSQEVLDKETADILTCSGLIIDLIKGEFLLPNIDVAQDFMRQTFSKK